jgi:hypothetical protein
MAEPGLSELITTTIENRTGIIQDNVTNHNIVASQLKEYGQIKKGVSGRTLLAEMSYDENGTFIRYNGAQALNISSNPVLTSAEFIPKQFAVAVVMNGREMRQNAGEEGIIDLAESRIKVAEATLENNYNADCFSDGTADGGLQIGGLKLLISKTPTTGTVGGINRALAGSAFYRNYKFDTATDWAGGATSAVNIKELYGKVQDNTQQNMNGPKYAIAGKTHYAYVRQASQAIQILTDPKLAKLGFKNTIFCEMPVVLGSSINFGGQTLIQDDLTYFIDPKSIHMKIYKGANFERLEKLQSINQDAWAQLIIWMGNFTLDRAATNGVLFDS